MGFFPQKIRLSDVNETNSSFSTFLLKFDNFFFDFLEKNRKKFISYKSLKKSVKFN